MLNYKDYIIFVKIVLGPQTNTAQFESSSDDSKNKCSETQRASMILLEVLVVVLPHSLDLFPVKADCSKMAEKDLGKAIEAAVKDVMSNLPACQCQASYQLSWIFSHMIG
jgi:hypothetical protein